MQEVSGTVSWELRDNTGAVLQSGTAPLSVGALSYAALPELDFNKTDPRNHYISFSFSVNGTVLSSGSALFTKPKHFNFINPNLQVSVSGDEITVTADAYAKYVYISNETDDLVLSDNFFDMNAGKKTVKILSGKTTNLTVKSVYDVR